MNEMVKTEPGHAGSLVGASGRVSDREVLAPYLPRLVIEWVATHPERRHQTVDGTIAYVDISGFTKLSEALATHGKIGAEELAAAIGNCFSPLLDIAYANGGRLLKFGGDALLLLFSGADHEARGCRATFEMRAALRVVGQLTLLGHRVVLRMSAGIHSGRFDLFLVGRSHRELVVAGPAASATVRMESVAVAGEILVSPSTASALVASDLGGEKQDGHLLRRAPSVAQAMATGVDHVGPGSDLAGCVPTAIVDALLGTSHEPEHRRVVVAFVHFDGIDAMLSGAGPGVAVEYIDRLVTDVQEAADAQGVTFLGTDIDHDGGKIILVAGAPSTSGDDEHHMLLALRQIMDCERTPAVRVGVNRGPVFAGDIGPSYRRTFTVMGDTVNLAARLMAKAAPGHILATPEVVDLSSSTFEIEHVPPFTVKGKAKPVHALDVGVRTGSRTTQAGGGLPPRRPASRDGGVARPGGGCLGGLGIGHRARGRARGGEVPAGRGVRLGRRCHGDVVGGMRVLPVLHPLWRTARFATRALGTAGHHRCPQRSAVVDVLSQRAPELVPWASLVGAVVDIDVPASPETRDLEPEFWRARLSEVVMALLGDLLPTATVLVVEDSHWMDEASAEVFRHVVGAVGGRPWLLCFTRRDVESGLVVSPDDSTRLRLEPLGEAEAAELVQVAARDAPLLAHDAARLAERSGGNPLFLRELVAAARDAQDIDSLPDSVEAVIAARIDRLSADDRHFLRRVSVLGRSAPFDLLGAVLDEAPATDDPIWARLGEFAALDVGGNLVFRHALVCDSAYDGLSYRLRRQLHARAGEAIRIAAGATPDEHAELLSLHYLQAQEYHEAWTYSLVAAERARAVYANIEAAGFFERALAASRRLPELTAEEVASVHEALGDARDGSGGYLMAADQFRAARRLRRGDPLAEARLMLKLSRIQGWLDRYSNALRWITRWHCVASRMSTAPRLTANGPSSWPGTGGSAKSRGTIGAPSRGAAAPSSKPNWPTRKMRWPTRWPSWTGRTWS